MTSTAAVRTLPRCAECRQALLWCSCTKQPAQTCVRRGRHEIGVLLWCKHDPRGTLGCFPLDCPLTQAQMIAETAKASPEPHCRCIEALLEEQEKQ